MAFLLLVSTWLIQEPSPKTMFYNPFGVDAQDAVAVPFDRTPSLRAIKWVPRFGARFRHCGIHYWLESERKQPLTEAAASAMGGRFTIHIRSSCNGFLTVFDLEGEGRELTPRFDTRYSGHMLGDQIFVVPGIFQFTSGESAKHVAIAWARAQSEVARDPRDARERIRHWATWKTDRQQLDVARETEETTPGEVGTYVVNRFDAGVAAEIILRSRASMK